MFGLVHDQELLGEADHLLVGTRALVHDLLQLRKPDFDIFHRHRPAHVAQLVAERVGRRRLDDGVGEDVRVLMEISERAHVSVSFCSNTKEGPRLPALPRVSAEN